MKGIQALLLSLLIATAVCPSWNFKKCDQGRASVLSWLKNVDRSVPLQISSTKGPWKQCKASWLQGTCCDQDALDSAKLKVESLASVANNQFTDILGNSINKHHHRVGMCKNKDFVKAQIKSSATSSRGASLKGFTEESAAQTIEFSHLFSKSLPRYMQKRDECFNYEVQEREVGYCDGCSADTSLSYRFGASQQVKLTANQCQYLAPRCVEPWKFIFDTRTMDYFASIVDNEESSSTEVYGGSNLADIKKAFEACPDGKPSVTCHAYQLTMLCDAYSNRMFPDPAVVEKSKQKKITQVVKGLFSWLLKWKKGGNDNDNGQCHDDIKDIKKKILLKICKFLTGFNKGHDKDQNGTDDHKNTRGWGHHFPVECYECDPTKEECPCDPTTQDCPCDPTKGECPCDPATQECPCDPNTENCGGLIPGQGNGNAGTECGCPVCGEIFLVNEETGDYEYSTVNTENFDCTVSTFYLNTFTAVSYTFETPYGNDTPIYSLQTRTCTPDGVDNPSPTGNKNFDFFVSQTGGSTGRTYVSSYYTLDPATCAVSAQYVENRYDASTDTTTQISQTFNYDPVATPFTGLDNVPDVVVETQVVPN